MIKKMTLLAMVVGVAAAFAVPSMASAAQLTQPAGTTVPVGTTITGTSTNTVSKVGTSTLECTKVMVSGIVAQNDGTTVAVEMDKTAGADTAEGCKIVGLGPTTIVPTLEGINATGSGPGTASFKFTVGGSCTAESTTPNSVTWNHTTPEDTIHVSTGLKGTCGTGSLAGDFTLETTSGKPILIDG